MEPTLCPKVSVIILNWNGRELLRKCLDSVQRTNYENLEVIVVDNASTDGSQSIVNHEYMSVKLIQNRENLGYAEGNNVGIRNASGEYIVLLNNDTIVHEEWISELVRVAKTNNRAGILGCKVYLMGTKTIQHAGSQLSLPSNSLFSRSLVEDRCQFDEVMDMDYISGEAMMVKREVFDRIGLLDKEYFAYWEDVDFCYRARRHGYRIVYVPTSVIEHMVSASWDRRPLRAKILGERNRILFILKNLDYRSILRLLALEPIHVSKRLLQGYWMMASTRNPNVRAAVLGLPEKAPRTAVLNAILGWPVALVYAYAWNVRFLSRTIASKTQAKVEPSDQMRLNRKP